MPLIAMTREMGSLGKDVAAGVAEALGISVLHHEVIEPLADKMRLRKSHVIRLLEGARPTWCGRCRMWFACGCARRRRCASSA